MHAPQLELLVDELALVAGRIERESALRIDAALADLRRVDAERELRLTNLERAVADRLVSVKDGTPGQDADPELIARLVSEHVGRAVAAIPAPQDGRSLTVEEIRPVLAEMVAAIPPAAPGQDADPEVTRQLVADLVAQAVSALPKPVDGKSVDPADVEAMVNAAVVKVMAGITPPRDGRDADPAATAALVKEGVAKAVAAIPAPKDGKSVVVDDVLPMLQEMVAAIPAPKDGKNGRDGIDGRLPIAKEWIDGVHYAGAVAVHQGSTYQAVRDTGREPPHEDWICIAAAGRAGVDGRSFTVRETFADDVTDYRALDVVALGGAAFVARRDEPGACPGEGWQLISSQGKRGNPGDRGPKGDRGMPGPAIERMSIDGEGMLTITNADGSTVECDLYPLLAKVR